MLSLPRQHRFIIVRSSSTLSLERFATTRRRGGEQPHFRRSPSSSPPSLCPPTTCAPATRQVRWKSSSSGQERLRVAVVGGGCAGLSAALHLAPLVEQGLIASPIDVYDATDSTFNTVLEASDDRQQPQMVPELRQVHRDIGVGVWSTALDPWKESDRVSHQTVYRQLTQDHGTWLGRVGYRTPSGSWLLRSELPGRTNNEDDDDKKKTDMPALLFLREKDLILTLQKAIHWEEHMGTVRVIRDGSKSRVESLTASDPMHQPSMPWSSRLVLADSKKADSDDDTDPDAPPHMSDRDYHLVVAADGTYSVLRRTYGGHEAVVSQILATGGGSSLLVPSGSTSKAAAAAAGETTEQSTARAERQALWEQQQHEEAVGLQDRQYTVFRGNSRISAEQLAALTNKDDAEVSFQTWGTGRSMRFATVPMTCPPSDATPLSDAGSMEQPPIGREEHQVWFITIDDEDVWKETDPVKRRDLLLEKFEDWHAPIPQIVQGTDPEEILMARAVAHRHCMGPVLRTAPPGSMDTGPALVFLGDAYMTIDPILAQGFTVAMEGSADLAKTIQRACLEVPPSTEASTVALAFDPYALRRELKIRHDARMDRLICLLRATELVQALGQPTGESLFGMLNTHVLRPFTFLLPNAIKAPIFSAVLKYSLGKF